MTEQIVDIMEANMPASSDVVAQARSAGGAAGMEAGAAAGRAAGEEASAEAVETAGQALSIADGIRSGFPAAIMGTSPYYSSRDTLMRNLENALKAGFGSVILVCDLDETDNTVQHMGVGDYADAARWCADNGIEVYAVNFHNGNTGDAASYRESVNGMMEAVSGQVTRCIVFNERTGILADADAVGSAVGVIRALRGDGWQTGVSVHQPMMVDPRIGEIYDECDMIGVNLYLWGARYGGRGDVDMVRRNLQGNMTYHDFSALVDERPGRVYVNETGIRSWPEYMNNPPEYRYDSVLGAPRPRGKTVYLQALLSLIGPMIDRVYAWYDPSNDPENLTYLRKYNGRGKGE